MRPACSEFAELRSAFVDGALGAADYDRLSAHLAGCAACRRDVRDLRTLGDLVRGDSGWAPGAPVELSARLVSIGAGPDGFHRSITPGRAPARWSRRPRHDRRVRVAVAGLAVAGAVVAAGVTGYVAAPDGLAAVTDPAAEAEAEFSSALGAVTLSSDLLGAATVAVDSAAQVTVAATSSAAPSTTASGGTLSATQARTALRRAVAATETVSYVGEQGLVAEGSGHTYAARMQVVSQPGAGSQISVLSQNGRAVASNSSRPADSARLAGDDVVDLLAGHYELAGARGAVVAGRPATLLQASESGVPAARWWVDDATGLVLWHQRLDPDGAVRLSTGFTSFEPREQPGLVQHLTSEEVLPSTDVTLTLSHLDTLVDQGWAGQPALAGMDLTRLRTDQADDPQAVNLVYSDGLDTVSVHEQHGRLADPPDGAAWDVTSRSWVRPGASNLATWQSGDTVLTVITDGSPQRLAEVIAQLPHAAPVQPTTMERIQAGWAKIVATLLG